MKSIEKSIIVICVAGILLCSCQKYDFEDYNFEYDPPYINARLNEVFPVSVKQTPRKVGELEMSGGYQGYEASYLEGKITMRVIKCPDEKAAHSYFGSKIIEEFKKKKSRVYNNLDNRWKALGTDSDGREWIAWVNTLWIFVLSGADDASYELAVRACRFVSRVE